MSFAEHKLSEITLKDGLNLLCHKDDINIINDRPDLYMEISSVETLKMADKFTERTWTMCKADEDFKSRLKVMYPDMDIVADGKATLQEYPLGIRHVVGLIVCTNMAINTGRLPFWRFPEANLHPSTQSKLAELAVRYMKELQANVDLHRAAVKAEEAQVERAAALEANPEAGAF